MDLQAPLQSTPADPLYQSAAESCGPARRIALVVSGLRGGGAERVVTRLAAMWAAQGQHVTVVTLGGDELDAYVLPRSVNRIALHLAQSSRNRLEGLGRAIRRAYALRRAITRVGADVVVSFGDRTNVLALLATIGTSVPTVVSERTDPRAAANAWQWRLTRRLLYGRAARVLVQTERVASWARERWGNISVIPNFVERPRQFADPGIDRGPRQLVALGRLEHVKGFDLLFEAFASVASAHPEWNLAVFGEGSARDSLQKQIRKLGAGGRISMPGRIADPTPQLAAAHAFVLSSRREGFPNALLEAMACGLPVVAFDCPSGPAEIVTDGKDGILVPPGDVGRLASALDGIMRDAGERARLGNSARSVSLRYAPERVLALWSGVLFDRVKP